MSERREIHLVSFPPPIPQNPYQRLLYSHLAQHGVRLVAAPALRIAWLVAKRNAVDVLHFHWQQPYYRFERGPGPFRVSLSWIRIGLLALRLMVARMLGYRIVWTVHQVYPHERSGRHLDQVGAAIFARMSHALIVHDAWTQESVRRELGERAASKCHVIPHGPYVGVYPPGRPRDVVRAELEIDAETVMFLCFGELRVYKDVGVLLDAFDLLDKSDVALVIAGPQRGSGDGQLDSSTDVDPRIRLRLGFVPDTEVAGLFDAADVVVSPRGDGGTSGALILALSFQKPVIVAMRPAYEELAGGAAWYFAPGDPRSLAVALDSATVAAERARKARATSEQLAGRTWERVAEATHALLVPDGTVRAQVRSRIDK